MPQLDTILWFSQTFWFFLFCLIFISFTFSTYIPMTFCMEGLPFYKKKENLINCINFSFIYSRIQDFFFFRGIC
jgi:hypothetical protein